MRQRYTSKTIAGRVQADGSIVAGSNFTIRKGAVGQYTISFPDDFRVVSCVAASGGVNTVLFSGSYTENSVLVSATTSTDTLFSFIAVGV
jgi:hypothetical protein